MRGAWLFPARKAWFDLDMTLLRAAGPAFALSCLIALVASACGSSAGSNVNGGDGNSGNGSGAGTSNGTGGSIHIGDPDLGLGGDATASIGGAGIDACAGDLVQAQRIPLDMYVMLDVSGSMTEPTVGNPQITKWEAVSSALTDFVSDKASDGIGMGLQLFPQRHPDAPTSCSKNQDCGANFGPCYLKACWGYPDGLVPCNSLADCGQAGEYGPCLTFGRCSKDDTFVCPTVGNACGTNPDTNADLGTCTKVVSSTCLVTDDCRAATYADPAAAIAPLPGAKADLVNVIQAAMPKDGLTPTGPALTGAIEQASAWAKAHPDHQVVAVLATDGVPTLKTAGQYCASVTTAADIDAVVNVAANGQAAMPKISTFVIGVVSPVDVTNGAPDILDAIANAGGTDQSFIVNTQGNVQTEFRNALNQIRQAGLSCDLLVPQPEAGKTLDFGQVNVKFDDGTGAKTLGYVKAEENCDANGGWYYDVDPAAGAPARILTCPTTCDAFQKTDMGSVKIELGCETRVVVK
jgi:hypothetical protein